MMSTSRAGHRGLECGLLCQVKGLEMGMGMTTARVASMMALVQVARNIIAEAAALAAWVMRQSGLLSSPQGSTMRSGIATVGISDGYGATGELEQKSPEDDQLPNYPSMEDGAPEGPGGQSNDSTDPLHGGEVHVHRARSGIMQ